MDRTGASLSVNGRRLWAAVCRLLLLGILFLAACTSKETAQMHENGIRSVVAHLEGVT
jgi:hypothetical protein